MALACAVDSRADSIVSRDKDLLSLGAFRGTAINTPEVFCRFASAPSTTSTSTGNRASSAAASCGPRASSSAQRISATRFSPALNPYLFNSLKKAWYAGAVDGLARATWSRPMRAVFDVVSACATNGDMATPKSSMMKSRRPLGDAPTPPLDALPDPNRVLVFRSHRPAGLGFAQWSTALGQLAQ
jgi:hypothetical protein